MTSKSGTLAYLAPEVYSGRGYDFRADWWSLGVTFYECIYSKVCARLVHEFDCTHCQVLTCYLPHSARSKETLNHLSVRRYRMHNRTSPSHHHPSAFLVSTPSATPSTWIPISASETPGRASPNTSSSPLSISLPWSVRRLSRSLSRRQTRPTLTPHTTWRSYCWRRHR